MCALFGLGLWPFRGLQHITVSKCLPICVIEDDPKNWKFVNILICDGTMKSSNSRPLFVDFLRKEFFKRILHATICLFSLSSKIIFILPKSQQQSKLPEQLHVTFSCCCWTQNIATFQLETFRQRTTWPMTIPTKLWTGIHTYSIK